MAFTVDDGRITEIDFVVNPEKLTRVPLPSRNERDRGADEERRASGAS
jgi:hypothetical protein